MIAIVNMLHHIHLFLSCNTIHQHLSVGDFNTYTAQLLMTEGERIMIQIVQMVVNISVPEEQINLVELLALREVPEKEPQKYSI